nr:hypothetical protein [uncultured Desulfobacter sp.]
MPEATFENRLKPSEKEIESIKKHVAKARKILERHNKKLSGTFFGNFPCGACGNTSDILSKWLQSKGFKNIKYVSGQRGNTSHGWLEIEGIIIDITSDQFEDGLGDVYIGTNRIFHDTFLNQRFSDPDIAPTVEWTYSKFCDLMESEPQ